MKKHWVMSAILAAGLVGFLAGSGFTEEGQPSEEEMMKMMMELAKPSDGHKAMEPMVGDWDVTAKMWMPGEEKPDESKATSKTTWTLGGRYALIEYKGEFGIGDKKMPFEGRGVMAFDNFKKQYQTVWFDSFSTNIMTMTGPAPEEGKDIDLKGTWDGPMGKMDMRHTYTIESNDKHVMTGYMSTPEGEMKHMELTFTRKKAAAAAANPRCCPPQKTKGPGY